VLHIAITDDFFLLPDAIKMHPAVGSIREINNKLDYYVEIFSTIHHFGFVVHLPISKKCNL